MAEGRFRPDVAKGAFRRKAVFAKAPFEYVAPGRLRKDVDKWRVVSSA
ncbi:hypothetical protein E2C01_068436 [Portunus trituberculatus]|uniref:Uncharacterized protein n=1 Tax=Portunus trituberculatus TaxID=210409 RepID=A0A5B7HNU3_PORTR|nr:hypothetical protein [Portunus trituberculatus]